MIKKITNQLKKHKTKKLRFAKCILIYSEAALKNAIKYWPPLSS